MCVGGDGGGDEHVRGGRLGGRWLLRFGVRDALGANGCDLDVDLGVVRVVEGEGCLGGVCLGVGESWEVDGEGVVGVVMEVMAPTPEEVFPIGAVPFVFAAEKTLGPICGRDWGFSGVY